MGGGVFVLGSRDGDPLHTSARNWITGSRGATPAHLSNALPLRYLSAMRRARRRERRVVYTTKRVGGGVQDLDAIKLLKFGTS
jgi:hypothetical protein